MNVRARAALSALALAAVLAPHPAPAQTGQTGTYNLAVRQYDQFSAGEIDGRMRLRVSPDGIVSGTYLDSQGRLAEVTGGLTGNKIWIQIGNGVRRTYQGTFADGKITATAPGGGLHVWKLEAAPAAH